jgi:hypothetical protein
MQSTSIEPLHPVQLEALRRMTPAEKWNVSLSLLNTATAVRTSSLQQQHPDWNPTQISQKIAAERLRARD